MKTAKKILCLMLVAALAVGMIQIASAADFTDAASIENKEAAAVLTALKVVDGYPDGSFGPDRELTRAEAAAIIGRMMLGRAVADNLPASGTGFSDVASDHWASKYIAYCVSQQIILGRTASTFDPNANVTAAELAIMLMRALKVGTPSRYVGANWEMNAIVDGMQLGILDTDSDYTSAAKRGDVAQYAFNALTYSTDETTTNVTRYLVTGTATTPVELNNTALIGVTFDSVAEAVAKAQGLLSTAILGKDYNITPVSGTKTVPTDSVGDKVYGLSKAQDPDQFGRPVQTTWSATKPTAISNIYTFIEQSSLKEYTTSVTGATAFADLGLSKNPDSVQRFVDGKQVATASSLLNYNASTIPGSGNGVKTEIYKITNSDNSVTYRIVQVNTYVGRISLVTAATAVTGVTVTIENLSTSPNSLPGDGSVFLTAEADGFARNDIVLYQLAYDSAAPAGYYVVDVKAAASEKVTATTTGTANFTTAGKTYYYSEKHNPGLVTRFSEEEVYLDEYGYVINVKGASSAYIDRLAFVIRTGSSTDDWNTQTNRAELLMPDGTTQIVNTSTPYTLKETIVEFSTNPADGKYILTEVTDTTLGSSITLSKGKPQFTAGGGTYYGDASTLYVVRTGAQGSYKYAAYVGYANVPSIVYASGAAVKAADTVAGLKSAVYIAVSATTTASTDVYFLASAPINTVTSADGTRYYEYFVYINGVMSTKSFDRNDYALGCYTVVNTNETGVISLGSRVYRGDIGVLAYNSGVLTFDNSEDSGIQTGYAALVDAQVFTYSVSTGTMTAIAAESINNVVETGYSYTTRTTDGTISYLYIFVA